MSSQLVGRRIVFWASVLFATALLLAWHPNAGDDDRPTAHSPERNLLAGDDGLAAPGQSAEPQSPEGTLDPWLQASPEADAEPPTPSPEAPPPTADMGSQAATESYRAPSAPGSTGSGRYGSYSGGYSGGYSSGYSNGGYRGGYQSGGYSGRPGTYARPSPLVMAASPPPPVPVSSPPPPRGPVSRSAYHYDRPSSNVAINPPLGTEYIPYVNIGMDFNMDLSIFTYDLAQQIARVVLWNVPASSNLDATIYTEEGATPQSQTVRITAKFYDGDQARVNALQASVQNLGQLTFPAVLGPLIYNLPFTPSSYTGGTLNPYVSSPPPPPSVPSPPSPPSVSSSPLPPFLSSPPPPFPQSPPPGRRGSYSGNGTTGGYGRYGGGGLYGGTGSYGNRSSPTTPRGTYINPSPPPLPALSPSPPPPPVLPRGPASYIAWHYDRPNSTVAINPTVTTEYIPYANIGMDFNISPSQFTYQLAQQIAQVVLGSVPASSNLDATVYDEEGVTPQSTTIRITAKFYDGDTAQANALAALVSNLGQLTFPASLGPIVYRLPFSPSSYTGGSLNPFINYQPSPSPSIIISPPSSPPASPPTGLPAGTYGSGSYGYYVNSSPPPMPLPSPPPPSIGPPVVRQAFQYKRVTASVNPPSNAESIPVVNLRMEFNMDLSIFTYQLAQQVAQVVLAGVSNSSNMDATIFTEPGDSTPFSQFICITAKFYDADYGANYQLYSVGATLGGLPFPAILGPLLPQLPTPPYRPPAYVGLSLNPFASTPSPPPPSSPSPTNAPVFFPGLSLVYRHPETELPIKSPSTNDSIPFVNIRMEFNLDLSNLTFQLGQQILDVVLQQVPATSNYEALLYTEQGSTSQSRFIYITAKFYDGDVSQVNSLLRDAPYLGQARFLQLPSVLGQILSTPVTLSGTSPNPFYVQPVTTVPLSALPTQRPAGQRPHGGHGGYGGYGRPPVMAPALAPAMAPGMATAPPSPSIHGIFAGMYVGVPPLLGPSAGPVMAPIGAPLRAPGPVYAAPAAYRSTRVASPDAVNASTTSAVLPVVTIPLSFLDLTLQTFTPDLEQALVDSVQSSLSRAANVNISLANIAAGSVNLVVETIFLDANQEAAAQLLNNAQLLASGESSGLSLPASLGRLGAAPAATLTSIANPSYIVPIILPLFGPAAAPTEAPMLAPIGAPSANGTDQAAPPAQPPSPVVMPGPPALSPPPSPIAVPAPAPAVVSSPPPPRLTRAPRSPPPPPSPPPVEYIPGEPLPPPSPPASPPPPPPVPVIGFQSSRAPAPDAAPVVTAESIPVVTISYALPDLTLDSFTPDLKQSLVDAIVDALPSTSNVDVYLTNIRSGSVSFDTVISFLDGNTDTAQALSDSVAASATGDDSGAASSGIGAIKLPASLGNVQVTALPEVLSSPNPNAVNPPPPPSPDATAPAPGPFFSTSPTATAPAPGPIQPKPATATFEISLSNYTVASFTASEQTAFKTQIISFLGVAPSTVTVDLQNIRAGSIIFNTVVTFLNGDVTRAASLLAVIQQDPSLVFGTRFGTVTYTGGGQVSTASTAPPPPASSSHGLSKGQIAGIAVGSVAGFLIVVGVLAAVNGGLVWYYLKHHRKSSDRDEHGLPVTAPSHSGSATAAASRAASAAAPHAASAAAADCPSAPEGIAAQGEQAAEPLELQPDQPSQKTSFLQKLKQKTTGKGHQAVATSEAPEPAQAPEPQSDQPAETTGFFQKLKLKGFRGGSAGEGYEAAPHTPRNV